MLPSVNYFKKLKLKYNYSVILLREIVISDFKLRYQNSILGYLWSLLRPLATFAVLYFVFVRFLKVGEGVPHFAIYLLVGIVLWNFFVEITVGNVSSISAKSDLIRKINFPKYVIVLATSFSALINLALNFIVIFIFMIIFGASPSLYAIIFLPLLIIELYLLGLGFALMLAAANVRYKDIGYIWEVGIQAGFYATPILYPITMIPLVAQKISILNPMAQIIQDSRYFLVTQQTATGATILTNSIARVIPFLLVGLVLVTGIVYFRNNSKKFAEEV